MLATLGILILSCEVVEEIRNTEKATIDNPVFTFKVDGVFYDGSDNINMVQSSKPIFGTRINDTIGLTLMYPVYEIAVWTEEGDNDYEGMCLCYYDANDNSKVNMCYSSLGSFYKITIDSIENKVVSGTFSGILLRGGMYKDTVSLTEGKYRFLRND
jgi:hypothetical protein